MNYNLAQSWLFYEIAPVYRVIIWRNRIFLLTLRQNINNEDLEKAIIGRENEKRELKKYISSEQSEFIAIYGRRRVGKTFLVKELLEGQFTFKIYSTHGTFLSTKGVIS